MLYNLQYVLGDELFLEAMQHYFQKWKMAHPYFEDFRESIIKYTKVDLLVFDQWLETSKTIDYSINNVKNTTEDNFEITFERKGECKCLLILVFMLMMEKSTNTNFQIMVCKNTMQRY